jgi:hypothetical protein
MKKSKDNLKMKIHYEIFDALIDPARETYWYDDLKQGPESVSSYAENGMSVYLTEKEYVYIFNLYKQYIDENWKLNFDSNKYYYNFKRKLINYKYEI